MDPLSDLLRAIRLTGAYFYLVEATRPWTVWAQPARTLLPRVLPASDHVISYHVVTSGEAFGGLLDGPRVRLAAGDVIVFPQGDAHVMAGDAVPDRGGERLDTTPARYPHTVRLGPAAPAETTFVCGFLGCDLRPFNPLLAALPRCLHVPGLMTGWLGALPRQAVDESVVPRAGGDTVLTHMAELMFIECVRRHLAEGEGAREGWLAGLRDPLVGRVLQVLHARPAEPWTLAALAREVASSRSVVAERFAQVVGVPPMQYLTMWRLQLAAERLATSGAKVAAVGAEVGYESEAAFSRAFKRATGLSPASWRRGKEAPTPAGPVAS